MDEELLVLRPNLFNAIVPIYWKSLFRALVLGGIGFGLFFLIETFGTTDLSIAQATTWLVVFLIIFPVIPSVLKIIILHNTRYIFYKTHIVSEFELMHIKRHSTPYHQIVNITSKVSIWDRLCKSGDVTMHTAEDRLPDLTLFYIKNPDKIEAKLYEFIQQQKALHAKEPKIDVVSE